MVLMAESVSEGVDFHFEEVINDDMIDRFAALSGDMNPLHMNNDFARARGFEQRVAHGELIGALFSRLFGMYCPGENSLVHSITLKFHAPVYPGVTLRILATVEHVSVENTAVILKLQAINVNSGKIYVTGKAQAGFLAE